MWQAVMGAWDWVKQCIKAYGLDERSQLADIQSFYDEGRYNNMALILNATTELHGVYGRYGYGHGYVHGKKRDR